MSLLGFPLKALLLYHADIQNEVLPAGFHVCDGTLLNSSQQNINPGGNYQLPDLRNLFLLGADPTKAAGLAGTAANGASNAPGPKGTSGSMSTTLTTTQLPSHTHPITGTPGIVDSGHTHSIQMGATENQGDYSGTDVQLTNNSPVQTGVTELSTTGITLNAGSLTAASSGSGAAYDSRPNYYGIIILMKVLL